MNDDFVWSIFALKPGKDGYYLVFRGKSQPEQG